MIRTEPEKQFALVHRHIERIREDPIFRQSQLVIMVERNRGCEAEHNERAVMDIPIGRHRIDHQAQRFGILTTEDIKYIKMTMFNTSI